MKDQIEKMDKVMYEIKELTHKYLKEIYEQNAKLVKEVEELKKQLEVYKKHG